MLPHANSVSACGSVSFPRFAGEGRDRGRAQSSNLKRYTHHAVWIFRWLFTRTRLLDANKQRFTIG